MAAGAAFRDSAPAGRTIIAVIARTLKKFMINV